MQYHGEITIGGQSLHALYDTGSFDIVALSSLCKSCDGDKARYDRGKSATFKETHRGPMVMHFGSGSIKAEQDVENIQLGSTDSDAKVDGMPFWQVLEHNMPFWHSKAGGRFSAIVGLCHPAEVPLSLALGNARDTVLERLKVDRFAFCLTMSGPGNAEDGFLTVGVQESALSAGAFVSVPVVSSQRWAIELLGPKLGDQAMGVCSPKCTAIVDSGSSLLLVPPSVMSALESAIQSSGISDDSCEDVSRLPPLEFELGGKTFSLPPEAYMVEDNQWGVMMTSCKPAVAIVDRKSSGGPMWSLGLPFLRHFYTVFDRAGPKLHVRTSGPPCGPQTAFAVQKSEGLSPSVVNLAGQHRQGARPLKVDTSFVRLPEWATNSSAPLEL